MRNKTKNPAPLAFQPNFKWMKNKQNQKEEENHCNKQQAKLMKNKKLL